MKVAPAKLQYAPPVARGRRATFRTAILGSVLVLVIVAWRYSPVVEHRVRLLYWQRKAMAYTEPANAIVMDNTASAGQISAKKLDWEVDASTSWRHTTATASAPPYQIHFARPWREFYELFAPPGRQSGAVLFLHDRKTPDRKQRLIAVDARSYDGTQIIISSAVFRPGSLRKPPVLLSELNHDIPVNRKSGDRIRIFAGQADPVDSSHFTIVFTENGNAGAIDGWLDAHDKITLVVTSHAPPPPPTPPAQVSAAQSATRIVPTPRAPLPAGR